MSDFGHINEDNSVDFSVEMRELIAILTAKQQFTPEQKARYFVLTAETTAAFRKKLGLQ